MDTGTVISEHFVDIQQIYTFEINVFIEIIDFEHSKTTDGFIFS